MCSNWIRWQNWSFFPIFSWFFYHSGILGGKSSTHKFTFMTVFLMRLCRLWQLCSLHKAPATGTQSRIHWCLEAVEETATQLIVVCLSWAHQSRLMASHVGCEISTIGSGDNRQKARDSWIARRLDSPDQHSLWWRQTEPETVKVLVANTVVLQAA